MTPKYKLVKKLAPHCPICDEELSGNNSLTFPWSCKCGIWEAEPPWDGEYIIKPKVK